MKYWSDKHDIYRWSPYGAFGYVHNPITKLLLLLSFLPWFVAWILIQSAIGIVVLVHDAWLWIFNLAEDAK